MNIYQNNDIYDNKNNHITWSANNIEFGKIDYTMCSDQKFKFDYKIPSNIVYSDLKTEVQRGLVAIYEKHKKTLAICVSGRDSEIIIRECVRLKLPCKIYFLNLWDMNNWMLSIVQDIAKELHVELCVAYLSEQQCMEEVIINSYKSIQAIKPTYLCLPYLFASIPTDEFIIVGEGDLAKDNPKFAAFFPPKSLGIPILSTEVIYRIWAQENKRYGEYYFHSSTPELILSAYNDPLLDICPPSIKTSVMLRHYWPELKFNIKTLNWENDPSKNLLIRKIIFNLNVQREQVAGTIVPHSSVAR
jgi:hypothetical protein